MKRSRPYTDCIVSFKRDHFDTMDFCSRTDKGFRSERDRNRRDQEVKMRSLKVLGSERDEFGRNHARKSQGPDKNGTDKGLEATFMDKTSVSRTSSGIDKDVSDRKESARSSWRKSYGAERESGDGGKEGLERADGPRTPLRKGLGHERDGAESSKHYSTKSFGSEKDGLERSEGLRAPWRKGFGHDRDGSDRGETGRSSSKRGFGNEELAEGGRTSPDFPDRATSRASKKGYESEKDRAERGEDFRDMLGKVSPDCEPKGDTGKSPRGRGSGSDSHGKESLKVSPRSGRGLDRDGGGESFRISPRKGPGFEKDGLQSLKFSPRKGCGADRDSVDRPEVAKVSPKEKDRLHRESEKRSPGKNHRFSPDEADRRSWHRSSSAKCLGGWDHDGLGERDARKKKVPESLTTPFIRRDDRDGQEPRIHIVKGLRSERERHRREEATKGQLDRGAAQEGECGGASDDRGVARLLPSEGSPNVLDLREGVVTEQSLKDSIGVDTGEHQDVKPVSIDSDENLAEQVAQKDKVEASHMLGPSSSSWTKSEMEEGELEPEEEVLEEAHKVDEAPEDGKERAVRINSRVEEEGDTGSHPVNELDAHVEEEMEADQGTPREVVKGEDTETDLEGQSTVFGGGSDPKVDGGSEQLDYMETEEEQKMDTREVMEDAKVDLLCKAKDVVIAKDIDMEEDYRGFTLDLLSERVPRNGGEQEALAHQKSNWKMADQDAQKDDGKVEDLGRGLTLSLSTDLQTASEAGKHTEKSDVITTQESQRREDLQRANNSKAVMVEKATGEREEYLEPSCENHKQKRLKLGPLELSLGLPNIPPKLSSLAPGPAQLPSSSEPDRRSIQSLAQTRTNSDGFTTSLSFSHSHPFVHNPSCSLTRTSIDNQEYSCGSQPISQGNEQMSYGSRQVCSGNDQVSCGNQVFTGLSQDRSKHRREVPLYLRLLQNGSLQNHQGFPALSWSHKGSSLNERGYERVGSSQVSQGSHQIAQRLHTVQNHPDASLKGNGYEKQGSLPKDVQDRPHKDVQLAQAQSVSARDTRSEQHRQSEREKVTSEGERCVPPAQGVHSGRDEDATGARSLNNEKIGLLEIVTEPVAVMAQKLQELSDSFLEGLKDLVKDMLCSIEKREEFLNLQKIVQSRVDLTQETLLRAHRTQLEILAALKTGMQSFVQPKCRSLTYKALIEIFLQTRCQNFDCQSALPGDECECRICSQKSGFCNVCMCIVCSKFDFDANTCRWVGCDYCMHWCHTDCGIRMSYIAPGPSIRQAAGTSEMQFKCIACDHLSELFGFVKEVFSTCAEQWNAETLAKELDCVRMIFHGSEDMRGKQLCWKAEQMLQKLENKADAGEVCRSMLRFFTEGNAELEGTLVSRTKDSLSSKPLETCDRVADAVQAMFKVTSNAGSKLTDLDRARAALKTYDRELEEKRTEATELQYDRARKKASIEELETVVRIKQAEAKMFQLRADEARLEADGLQRIALAKCEKIEEEYASKYAKLRLNEAQERRMKRLEELQALERAHHDYQSMKTRMELEIKDLLKKMEATKRQLC